MSVFCTEINNNFSYDSKFLEKLNMKEKSEITFSYISDFRSTKIIREFVSDLCIRLGISKKWETRLILITDELSNNAIEYGSLEGEKNGLRVNFTLENGELNLSIEVEDTGNGESHKSAKEMILIRNKMKLKGFFKHNGIRGRGLFMIIEKLVDKLYFKDSVNGGLIVGIEKKIIIKKD